MTVYAQTLFTLFLKSQEGKESSTDMLWCHSHVESGIALTQIGEFFFNWFRA